VSDYRLRELCREITELRIAVTILTQAIRDKEPKVDVFAELVNRDQEAQA
jgi:hypothetical protein